MGLICGYWYMRLCVVGDHRSVGWCVFLTLRGQKNTLSFLFRSQNGSGPGLGLPSGRLGPLRSWSRLNRWDRWRRTLWSLTCVCQILDRWNDEIPRILRDGQVSMGIDGTIGIWEPTGHMAVVSVLRYWRAVQV